MRAIAMISLNAGAQKQERNSCQGCCIRPYCLPCDLRSQDLIEFNQAVRRRKTFQRGEHIFMEGNAFNALYILHSGSIKSFITSNNGEQQVTGFHFGGELLGLDGFDAAKHTYTAEALETSSVCELSLADFENFSENFAAFRSQLLKIVSRTIIAEHRLAFMLGKMNAEQKMASFILDISSRMKARGHAENAFCLSMTRYDMANYLGLAVETVSRLLTRFQEQEILDVDRRSVEISSMEKLHEIAENSMRHSCFWGQIASGGANEYV